MSLSNNFKMLISNIKMLEIVIIGLISGIPFSILFITIIVWSQEFKIPLEVLSTLALTRIPYSLKFIWAPVIDNYSLPILGAMFGHRKSWMILCATLTALLVLTFSELNPNYNFYLIYFIAVCISFSSATYDIAADAYRLDNIAIIDQAYGASAVIIGWRIGALISGAGIIYLSEKCGWSFSFKFIAILMCLGVSFLMTLNEDPSFTKTSNFFKKYYVTITKSINDLINRKYFLLIFLSILLCKTGEAMLGFMALPFYYHLGYSKAQIALDIKTFGLISTLLGAFIGAILCKKIGILKGLIFCTLAQMFSTISFIWLNHQQLTNIGLTLSLSLENLTSGMGSTAFIALLSSLCNRQYSGTQYSFLSSASLIINNIFSYKSGLIVNKLGWDYFFICTIIISFPSVVIIYYLRNKFEFKACS